MASILKKAAKYRRISAVLIEGEAHLKDPFIQPPQILKPPAETKAPSPDDVSDFPRYKNVPIPENIPYMEGKYRPPSIPFINGTFIAIQVGSHTTHICNKEKFIHGAHAV